MYLHGAIYDIDELVHENLHIHTTFSRCAKRNMTLDNILDEAMKTNLKTIAITDHHQPFEKGFEDNVKMIRQGLRGRELPFKVLVGGELSSYDVGKFSDTDEENASFDYRLYSCNHYHQDSWVHPEDRSLKGYIDRCFENINALLLAERADCIAHPFVGKYIIEYVEEDIGSDPCTVTAAFDDGRIAEAMELSKKVQTAWELNVGAILSDPVFYRRFFNIGREVGAVFNLGMDTHSLDRVDPEKYSDELKRILL